LVPASDGGDDLIGIGGPDEGFGVIVRLSKEAFDRALEIDEGSEDAALESSLAQLGEEASTAIISLHPYSAEFAEPVKPATGHPALSGCRARSAPSRSQ
jgi:hypothetical protein